MAVCDLDSKRVDSTKKFIQDEYAKSTNKDNSWTLKPIS